MARRQLDSGLCCAVRAQLIGHHHIGREALSLEQRAHQFHRCRFVAPSLHEQIENLAFVVNRARARTAAPQSLRPSPEMPTRCWPCCALLEELANRGLLVSDYALWHFLRHEGVTLKKAGARPNRTDLTSPGAGNAPLAQNRLEDEQQVQIERARIHPRHTLHAFPFAISALSATRRKGL
jgi:hypothetical protein